MKVITLYLPVPYIKALDGLVDLKFYPSRAEAIRFAIHDFLIAHKAFPSKEAPLK